MNEYIKSYKVGTVIAIVSAFFLTIVSNGAAASNTTNRAEKLTILFTGDMHSAAHKYPQLATLLKREREKALSNGSAVITVSSGDAVMGTLYHTLFSQEASDYNALNLLGFDAYTFGNHDFDLGIKGLTQALSSLPQDEEMLFVSSNTGFYNAPEWKCGVNALNIQQRAVLNLETDTGKTIKVGIIGIMGDNAFSCIANNENLLFEDRIESARQNMDFLKKYEPDFILILSHSGSSWVGKNRIDDESDHSLKKRGKSEDGKLASSISGADAIISGHDHVSLYKPLIVNNTPIVSSGSSLNYLGKLEIVKTAGSKSIEYELIPISDTISKDSQVSNWLIESRNKIDENIYNSFGIRIYDTICYLNEDIVLETDSSNSKSLGFLIAESYVYAVKKSNFINSDKIKDLISIVPLGIIRNEIKKGYVTYESLFNVLPLGANNNGLSGSPLVLIWAKGKDLYDVCELNASISSSSSDMFLFFGGGLTYTYNKYKIPLTKVCKVKIGSANIDENALYPIVTDAYTAQLIGLIKKSSFGLLRVDKRDSIGNIISDANKYALFYGRNAANEDGENNEGGLQIEKIPLTGWVALGEYLDSICSTNETESAALYNSLQPNAIEKSNIFAIIIYIAILLIIAFIIYMFIKRKIRFLQL